MTLTKRISLYVASLVFAVGAFGFFQSPQASAASTVCGSNYRLLDTYAVKSLGRGVAPAGETIATVNLYWNPYVRKNCMVTSAYGKAYGVPIHYATAIGKDTKIQHGSGYSTGWDDGSNGTYRYYAGPDYTVAQGSGSYCLDIQVDLSNPTTHTVLGSRYLYSVHC
jgi:hypothetical protein